MIQVSVFECLQHYLRTVQVVVTGTVHSICMIALDGAIQKKQVLDLKDLLENRYK